MTLYARSDVASTNVHAENGGCGARHSRPVINGAPQHPWGLDCLPCEDWLRVHMPDQWSATTAEIPETHDEKIAREDFEKRGAKDKDAILTLALARLAGIGTAELPESLTRMISGQPLHVPAPVAGMLECPDGHASPSGQKFCGECGRPLSQPAARAAIPGSERAPEKPAAPAASQPHVRMRDGRLEVLRAFARANGVDDSGKRSDLVTRLGNAGLTGKFGAFNAAWQPEPAAA